MSYVTMGVEINNIPIPAPPPPQPTHNQRWVVGMSRHTSCAPSSSERLSGLRSGRWGQCASSTASPFVWLLTAPLCCTHINRASHQSCWTSGCAGSFVLAMSSLCCTCVHVCMHHHHTHNYLYITHSPTHKCSYPPTPTTLLLSSASPPPNPKHMYT